MSGSTSLPGVMSRRGALGVGLGVVSAGVALHVAGVDDDALRAFGVVPHPEPDPADAALVRRAVREQRGLTMRLGLLLRDRPDVARRAPSVLRAARAQLSQLGGRLPSGEVGVQGVGLDELVRDFDAAGRARSSDALKASDTALASVLASMSAGHAQIARTLQAAA